jgi:cytochrome c peroxidase
VNYRSRLLCWILLMLPGAAGPCIAAAPALSPYCPPGFELIDGNRCALRSLYQQYQPAPGSTASINPGVGGLKTPLPVARENFSPQQIDLGRYLFFDPILSRDGSLACASCHDPDKGFSDGKPHAVGIDDQSISRSTPGLWNVGFLKILFWDGRAKTLEEQLQGPLYSANEMGTTREQLLKRLNANDNYRALFAQAFPATEGATGAATPGDIDLHEIYTALAAFESSLISLNSRYDQYAHGYHDALSANEIEGLNVFRSFVARCAECHTPPLFTNQQIAVIGTPEPDGVALDAGAQIPTGDATQRGGFKVPSLRNIALTAPYMHSGKFATLREAAEFYTLGRGHAVPVGEKLAIHWHIWEPQLSTNELDRLVDFLQTLTDESFKPQVPAQLPSGLAVPQRTATFARHEDNANEKPSAN